MLHLEEGNFQMDSTELARGQEPEKKEEDDHKNTAQTKGGNYQIITHQGGVVVNNINIKNVEHNFANAQRINVANKNSDKKITDDMDTNREHQEELLSINKCNSNSNAKDQHNLNENNEDEYEHHHSNVKKEEKKKKLKVQRTKAPPELLKKKKAASKGGCFFCCLPIGTSNTNTFSKGK